MNLCPRNVVEMREMFSEVMLMIIMIMMMTMMTMMTLMMTMMTLMTMMMMRETFSEGEYDSPHHAHCLEKCHSETITVDATRYGGTLGEMKITVNKVR